MEEKVLEIVDSCNWVDEKEKAEAENAIRQFVNIGRCNKQEGIRILKEHGIYGKVKHLLESEF